MPTYQLKAAEANRQNFASETTPYAIKECNMDVPEDFIENGNEFLGDDSESAKRNSIESSNSSSSGVFSSVNLETNRSDSESVGFSNENWLLRDRCLSLGSSGVSSGILALTMSDRDMSENSGSSLAERMLTSGRLKLRSNAILSLESRQFVTNLVPQRKSVFEVFDQCCCECKSAVQNGTMNRSSCESEKQRERSKVSNYQLELAQCTSSSSSSSNRCRSKSTDTEEVKCQREHLCVQTDPVDDQFAVDESVANSTNSPSTSDSSFGSKKLRNSCPDLVKSCVGEAKVNLRHPSLQPQQQQEHMAKVEKHQQSKEKSMLWHEKALHRWKLDDILNWLQSLGLDDVATILIGYDLCGSDVEAWTASALDDLGVPKPAQEIIFEELARFKSSTQMSRIKVSHFIQLIR